MWMNYGNIFIYQEDAEMSEKCVNTLSEFVKEICELDRNLICNGADRNEILLFRGQSMSHLS